MVTKEALLAERHAEELLRSVWYPVYGDQLPIDPIWIARQLQIMVFTSSMKDDASGALVVRPIDGEFDSEKKIFLNRSDARVRQRFSCAHELGHYYHLMDRRELHIEHVEWRDAKAAAGWDPAERYANAFSAALLMPAMRVKQFRDLDLMHPVDMALRFDVSEQSMQIRLDNLRS